MKNHMTGCVLHDGHLYGFDDRRLKCLDLEGNVAWEKSRLGKGALTLAGNRLLILSGRGELVIAEATSEEFKELARTKVLEGPNCWTTPVLLDGMLYVRNSQGHIACFDHRPDRPELKNGDGDKKGD